MKQLITLPVLIISIVLIHSASGQTITTFASGFIGITGITKDDSGNLWVGETGTGNNDSRISMISPTGTVYPVVINLPTFVDTLTGETSGSWRAYGLDNNQLMVVSGKGIDVNSGSLLFFDLSGFIPGTSTPLTTTDVDQAIHVSDFVYDNGFFDSNPYSAAFDQDDNIYVADAAANAIIKYTASTQQLSVLDTFPAYLNTYTYFPPFIDYVPTSIINSPSGGFYVCNLSGFPFVPGLSNVVSIDENGNTATFISGLSLTVDMAADDFGNLYILQFAEFDSMYNPVFGSAKIIRADANGNTSEIVTGFGPSAGMVLDGQGGAYVTSLFTGEVLHITEVTGLNEAPTSSAFSAYPNPFTHSLSIDFSVVNDADITISIRNMLQEEILRKELGALVAGNHRFDWNAGTIAGGLYLVTLSSPEQSSSLILIKQ